MSTTAGVDTALLRSSAKMLGTAVTSYQDIERGELLEIVRAARGHLTDWFAANPDINLTSPLYEACAVLLLVEHAIPARGRIRSHICDPVANGLTVAERLLRRGIRNPQEPVT
jgi:hypothetical protein